MLITDTAGVENIVSALDEMELLGVDTETTGFDPFDDQVIMFQIGNLDQQFIIDTRVASIEPLRRILESNKPKVLHNAKFDYKMVRGSFGIRMENMIDTMLAEMLLTCGLQRSGFSLKDLCLKYLDVELSKEEQTSFVNHTGDFTEEQVEYGRKDVIYPIRVLLRQMPLIFQEELDYIFKLECLAVAAFADMEFNGVLLDVDKWEALLQDAIIQRDVAKEKLDAIFKEVVPSTNLFGYVTINYNSDQQLKEAFTFLGFDIENTGKDILRKIDHDAARLILEYRKHEKVVSTYGRSFMKYVHPTTGRIHCTFRQLGAESGRVSCTKPNLQNIKAGSDFRNSFIASPGKKMVTADYSGCELRIIAEGSKDPVFIETFRTGRDLHSIVASTMFKTEVSKDKNPKLRKAAKGINFGLAYGMGAAGLAEIVGGGVEDAQEMLEKYFDSYPNIADYLEDAALRAIKCGYSVTMAGRKRYYRMPEDKDDRKALGAIQRKGKNTPIQGTNADMTKLALVWLRAAILDSGLDARLLNTVHDEIVVECGKSNSEEVKELVETVMIKAGQEFIKAVPIDVDASVEDYWTK